MFAHVGAVLLTSIVAVAWYTKRQIDRRSHLVIAAFFGFVAVLDVVYSEEPPTVGESALLFGALCTTLGAVAIWRLARHPETCSSRVVPWAFLAVTLALIGGAIGSVGQSISPAIAASLLCAAFELVAAAWLVRQAIAAARL